MNSTAIVRALIVSTSALALTVGSTSAQQTTGTPGSPSVDDNDCQVPFRFIGKLDAWHASLSRS